jgi:hypothetical protein
MFGYGMSEIKLSPLILWPLKMHVLAQAILVGWHHRFATFPYVCVWKLGGLAIDVKSSYQKAQEISH